MDIKSPGSNPKADRGSAIRIRISKSAQDPIKAAINKAVAPVSPASNHTGDRETLRTIRGAPAKLAVKAARPRMVDLASRLGIFEEAIDDAGVLALRHRSFIADVSSITMGKKEVSPPRAFDPPEEAVWHRMIAEAAYHRSQKSAFSGESALEHWLAAEEEIRQVLTGASTDVATEPVRPAGEAAPQLTPPLTTRVAKSDSAKSAARKRQIPKSRQHP